jgi:hypothetical protein
MKWEARRMSENKEERLEKLKSEFTDLASLFSNHPFISSIVGRFHFPFMVSLLGNIHML